jgi:carbonic anhydrase
MEEHRSDHDEAACGCHAHEDSISHLSRRRLFGAAAAAGLLAGGGTLLGASAARAQSTMSPAEALKTLMDGNQRFISGQMTSFQDDLQMLKQHTAEKQEPFAAVLSCADSRVPVELIFDQTIGHVFVTRVAGNIATTEMIASLEYGVAVLGTKTILVLGHANCGAVKAAMDNTPAPGQITSLYRSLRPAVNQANGNFQAAIEDNAKIQAQLLRESSPLLADFISKQTLSITPAFYDIETGKVTLLT